VVAGLPSAREFLFYASSLVYAGVDRRDGNNGRTATLRSDWFYRQEAASQRRANSDEFPKAARPAERLDWALRKVLTVPKSAILR
jgi:hypothetical protein